MARLLQGNINNEELPNKLLSFGYTPIWKEFSVLALQIDSIEDTEYHVDNEDLLLFTINTMIEELIPNKQSYDTYCHKQNASYTISLITENQISNHLESLTTTDPNNKSEKSKKSWDIHKCRH